MYYTNDTIPYPITGTLQSRKKLPPFITELNEGRQRWKRRFNQSRMMRNGENQYQYMMKNIYRMATEVSTTSGRLIKKIEEQGDLDNTLIIFTTDNGYFHGEHQLADKWYPHEESVRVPLIIRDPRMDPKYKGTTNDDFTLNVDLAPTLLGAAGLQAVPGMMGRDMSVLYRDDATVPSGVAQQHDDTTTGEQQSAQSHPQQQQQQQQQARQDPPLQRRHPLNVNPNAHLSAKQYPWREEFFYEHPVLGHKAYIPSSEALVRKDWKYMYWPDYDREQLFDLRMDPIEDNDRIQDPDPYVRGILSEMRHRFQELRGWVHSNATVTL
uniref:Sulfatase N-terminal domain-containing protein n=1 Tax=Craspedostauros australis TaxID=1486917 RepID=A0A7R9WNP9_9STRA